MDFKTKTIKTPEVGVGVGVKDKVEEEGEAVGVVILAPR